MAAWLGPQCQKRYNLLLLHITGPINQFVSWNKSDKKFLLNGVPFVPVGFNAYWLGYTEDYAYAPKDRISEIFKAAKNMEATVIRSHTLGFSSSQWNTLRLNDNTINPAAWEPIDWAFSEAQKYGIKLICPLTDAYEYYHGNYGDFCATRGIAKAQFWTDTTVRNDFKKYITNWLNHVNPLTGLAIKDSPELFIIEHGNELGNLRDFYKSTTKPTKEWITDISNFIRSIDSNHLIMTGSDECLGEDISRDFEVENIDVFSAHFYNYRDGRLDYGANAAMSIGKPYLVGEYPSNKGQEWLDWFEQKPNVKGTFFWSMYPHHNGLPSGQRIPHDDEGRTIWYDNGGASQLLLLSNHFRRMRGLPTTNFLPF